MGTFECKNAREHPRNRRATVGPIFLEVTVSGMRPRRAQPKGLSGLRAL